MLLKLNTELQILQNFLRDLADRLNQASLEVRDVEISPIYPDEEEGDVGYRMTSTFPHTGPSGLDLFARLGIGEFGESDYLVVSLHFASRPLSEMDEDPSGPQWDATYRITVTRSESPVVTAVRLVDSVMHFFETGQCPPKP